MPKGYVTTSEAAKVLAITKERVSVLIRSGRLPAERVGNIWIIKETDLELVKNRKPGRPRKS